eukprot:scaffold1834_cov331-Prasinococcus_capsulatus_cf.AAC.3
MPAGGATRSHAKRGGKGHSRTIGGGSLQSVVEARDAWERTPLHWAAVNGHQGVVSALLEAGADALAQDATGETPRAMAERRAQCSNRERPDGARASVWGGIATLLGGSAQTQRARAGQPPR